MCVLVIGKHECKGDYNLMPSSSYGLRFLHIGKQETLPASCVETFVIRTQIKKDICLHLFPLAWTPFGVLQFFKLLFSLANRCLQACGAFVRILATKTCKKCKRGKMEVIRMQIIFILCQHEAAVSQYMNYTY